MAKLTVPTFASLTNEASFLTQLNAVLQDIATALENTLSRDGTTPNQMKAVLDMNSNRITNLPAPTYGTDPVRLRDLTAGIQGPQGAPGTPGGPLADGDYGDMVVSASGTVWTLDPAIVTAVARTLLAQTTQALMRTTGLGLGNVATRDVGIIAGTAAAGDDSRFTRYDPQTLNSTSALALSYVSIPTIVLHTSGSAHSWTLSKYATSAWPANCQMTLNNSPTGGIVTVLRDTGVSLYVNGSTTSTNAKLAPGASATLINIGTNVWVIIGPGVTSA